LIPHDLYDAVRDSSQPNYVLHGLDAFHQTGEGAAAEVARGYARSGNPFPLIGVQWPSLLVTDPEDAEFFEGEIGNPLNPCLRIDPWQRQVIASAFDITVGEIAMKGCTGAGKGFISAMAANLLFDVFDPCRIHVTSVSFDHAATGLFGEITKWRKTMKCPGRGRTIAGAIADSERHYMKVLNPAMHDTGEKFSGSHSELTVYFFDEASGIPEIHYTNALKNGAKFFMLSNPRITEGWFRDLYRPLRGDGTKEEQIERENTTGYCIGRKGRRFCVTIPGDACANVRFGRLKSPVSPGRGIEIGGKKYGPAERISDEDFVKVKALVPEQIDLEQYQSIIDKSKEKWEVECYAHARFPSENPIRQVILQSWYPRHVAEWVRLRGMVPVTCFGLDVARSQSGDETVLAAGSEVGVRALHRWRSNDNMDHVKRILQIARESYGVDLRDGSVPICVEMGGGYGGGVSDRLNELGVWVMEFMPSGRAVVKPGLYVNARAEWYMLLARRLDPSDNWQSHPWALPADDKLHDDLSAPVKMLVRGGTAWQIEPKEDISRRLGRSPDSGDSVVCLYRAVFERHSLLAQLLDTFVEGSIEDDYVGDNLSEDEAVGLYDPHRAPGLPIPPEPDTLPGDMPEPPVPMTTSETPFDFASFFGADDDSVADVKPNRRRKSNLPEAVRRHIERDDDD